MKAIIKNIKQETYDVKVFTLELKNNLNFKPGQFVMLKLPDLPPRAYSISTPQNKNIIELTIKIIPDGLVTQQVNKLKENDEIDITGPYGKFYFENEEEITLIATGCGVASLICIARYIKEKNIKTKFKIVYSARTEQDIIFKQELDELNTIYTITRDPNYQGFKGRITKEFIKEQCNLNSTFYLCGLPDFVKQTSEFLEELNAKEIKKEIY